MERGTRLTKSPSPALILCLALLLGLHGGDVAAQSTTAFRDCYNICFLFCIVTPQTSVFYCSLKCLRDCVVPPPKYQQLNNVNNNSKNVTENAHFFCKIGCAASLCTNISTARSPNQDQVEGCVTSCSNKHCSNYC